MGVQLPPCSASHCALGCALSSPKHSGRHGSSLAHGPQAGQGSRAAARQVPRRGGTQASGKKVALTRTMLDCTRQELQQPWLLPCASGGTWGSFPCAWYYFTQAHPCIQTPSMWLPCLEPLPLKACHAPVMSPWMFLMSSLYQPQLPRGSEVELHGLAVALQRGFSMTLHIPLRCGHGSDLSKLLLRRSQATGHSFSFFPAQNSC